MSDYQIKFLLHFVIEFSITKNQVLKLNHYSPKPPNGLISIKKQSYIKNHYHSLISSRFLKNSSFSLSLSDFKNPQISHSLMPTVFFE